MTEVVAIDFDSPAVLLYQIVLRWSHLDLVFTNQHREKSNKKRMGQYFGIFIVVSFHSDTQHPFHQFPKPP